MIVGGLEEIRVDEANNEIYILDNYLNGRLLVFSLDKFEFKRGWGAYGKPLAEISTNDADAEYKPNGPVPKEFAGHVTFNFSNDGKVYIADRVANRIQVTDKQGKYLEQEFILAPYTGRGRRHRRRLVLAGHGTALPLYLGSHEQQGLVPEPR